MMSSLLNKYDAIMLAKKYHSGPVSHCTACIPYSNSLMQGIIIKLGPQRLDPESIVSLMVSSNMTHNSASSCTNRK